MKVKYKVWHIGRKEWIQDPWDLYIDPDGDVWEIEERGSYDRYMSKAFMTDNVKVVRYTGLKDRNGEEIYEGDIINDSFGNKKGVIRYNVHSAAFEISNYGGIHLLTSGNCDHFFEVIGNVYQDAHLLPKE